MSGQYSTRQSTSTRPLGDTLRELREARGEKVRTVAAAADMDASLLGKIERGKRFPTAAQIAALARHFGVPAVQFEAARLVEEFLGKLAANPEAAALALARVEESAGEYRVSKRPTAVNKPGRPVNKAGKRS